MQSEKTAAFSLQSILNQVLKPLDVKTKFYNAEVSVSQISCVVGALPASCFHSIFNIHKLESVPVEAVRVRKHLGLHSSQVGGGGAGVFLPEAAVCLVLTSELCADVHWHRVWLVTPFVYDLLYFIFSIRVTSVLW